MKDQTQVILQRAGVYLLASLKEDGTWRCQLTVESQAGPGGVRGMVQLSETDLMDVCHAYLTWRTERGVQ